MTLWHGTTAEAGKAIAETKRVSPGHPSQWDSTNFEPLAGYVYLSTTPADCAWHVQYRTYRGNYHKAPESFAIVEVANQGLLVPDEDDVAGHLVSATKFSEALIKKFILPSKNHSAMLSAARKEPHSMTDPDEDWDEDDSPYKWDWANDTGSEVPHPNFQELAKIIVPRLHEEPILRDALLKHHTKRACSGATEVVAVWSVPMYVAGKDRNFPDPDLMTPQWVQENGTKLPDDTTMSLPGRSPGEQYPLKRNAQQK